MGIIALRIRALRTANTKNVGRFCGINLLKIMVPEKLIAHPTIHKAPLKDFSSAIFKKMP